MNEDLAARALEANRKASDRLGIRVGLLEARVERWRARALLAERALAAATNRERRREAALRRPR